MSFYGKLAGGLISLALVGGSAAYVATAAGDVLTAAEQTAAELSCYVIKEQDGRIALFRDGSEEPLAVYSTPISEINPLDAELLKEGIRLRGLSEVSRLLEDLEIE
ncbi:MAG: hypothetical protein ACI4WS_13160 [Oscillospiraceae bacterium]